jgi:ribosomal protein L32E
METDGNVRCEIKRTKIEFNISPFHASYRVHFCSRRSITSSNATRLTAYNSAVFHLAIPPRQDHDRARRITSTWHRSRGRESNIAVP